MGVTPWRFESLSAAPQATSTVSRGRSYVDGAAFLPLQEFEHVGSGRAAIGGAMCAPRVTHSGERCSPEWELSASSPSRCTTAAGRRLIGSCDRARPARHGGDDPAPVSRAAAYRGVAHLRALAARQAGHRRSRRGRDALRGRHGRRARSLPVAGAGGGEHAPGARRPGERGARRRRVRRPFARTGRHGRWWRICTTSSAARRAREPCQQGAKLADDSVTCRYRLGD